VIEDTMFFPRLRRHAKWMFLFLALAFGLGFVGFGVGAGGIGVGDIFRGTAGGGGAPSISSAEKRTLENPKDAKAFRDLATAHQAAGNADEAIGALEDYLRLRPKAVDALRELAGLYLGKASEAQQRAQIIQTRSTLLAPGAAVSSIYQLGGRPLDPDPITNAVSTGFEDELSAALSEAQIASASAVGAYRRITQARPKDPTVQLELAQAAQSAGDTATAIAAFEAFLRLAPDDPTAPEVRRLLKQLRRFSTTG
jgi:tetratricopeptide (TPR) repeat protein